MWRAPGYRNVVAVLQNPFYAGAYAYGKSQVETRIVDGRVRKAYGRPRPREAWTALLRDHHEGYISWAQFELNQQRLARNAFAKRAGGAKASARDPDWFPLERYSVCALYGSARAQSFGTENKSEAGIHR